MGPNPFRNNPALVLFVLCLALLLGAVFFLNSKKTPGGAASRGADAETGPVDADQRVQKFNLTGFDEHGKKFWILEGEDARIDSEQVIHLKENVVLTMQDQTVVRTDAVRWFPQKGLLKTNAPVRVERQNATIDGLGFLGRPEERFLQLHRKIDMWIEEKTHLTCTGPMKVYYAKNKIVFFRDVRVMDERGILRADRMEVTFDSGQEKIKEIVAEGRVVTLQGTDKTYSQRAIYRVETGSVLLEGRPQIELRQKGEDYFGSIGNQSA